MREEHSAQLDLLVHKAMVFFETDRAAAWRCLRDASTLLGTKAGESAQTLRSIPSDSIGGGLARWLAKRALAYIEEHLDSKIEVGGIADHVSLSKSHFSRVQAVAGVVADGIRLDETRRARQTHDHLHRTDAHGDRTSLWICRSVSFEPMF
jgi:AraC-like DNA-binding protein